MPPVTNATISAGAWVFDAYGTLFDVNAAARRCGESLGERLDAVSALWRSKQLEYSWLTTLRGDYLDFWTLTGLALDHTLTALKLTDPALKERLLEAYFVLDPYPDARHTLETLRAKGLPLAILSNGSPDMLDAAVGRAGFRDLLDAVLSIDAVKIYKPHPKVYALACDRLQLPAEKIAFVSANNWDASGAARFGFRVVWINRRGATPDMLPGTPQRQITTLAELPSVLES